jgi:hypothetical protein
MTTDKALDLALEALEGMDILFSPLSRDCTQHNAVDRARKAITAIKQARSAPVQPVVNASAWFALVMNAAAELEDASHCLRDEDAKRVANSGAKYYRDAAKTLYTTPPAAQRQWVGLTDEEIDKHLSEDAQGDCEMHEFARALEAKLKKKNAAAQLAPVQEPVAFFDWYDNAHWGNEDFKEGCHRSWNAAIKYTTPPAQPAPGQEPVENEWRKLALQFDAHRMSALAHLRAMVQDPAKHADVAREFLASRPPAAQPAVPDAFGTREGEHPQYIQGWNDCRAEMLKGLKP